MSNWTPDNLDGPADFDELRVELRRAYVDFMQQLNLLRRMRREIDAQHTDPGQRRIVRLRTDKYQVALEDFTEASVRVYVFGGMLGAELNMLNRAEHVIERRRSEATDKVRARRAVERWRVEHSSDESQPPSVG
jgi:hypothetical protein